MANNKARDFEIGTANTSQMNIIEQSVGLSSRQKTKGGINLRNNPKRMDIARDFTTKARNLQSGRIISFYFIYTKSDLSICGLMIKQCESSFYSFDCVFIRAPTSQTKYNTKVDV